MSTASARISRWSRRFVGSGFVFLILWQVLVFLDPPRAVHTIFGLLGFVFHVIFGKGYALIPVYFDRELASLRAPALQFPATVGGTLFLGFGVLFNSGQLSAIGAIGWGIGTAIFVVTIGRTIRTNPTGSETGTGTHNRHRRRVDRYANLFIPIALLYLLLGTYEIGAVYTSIPPLFDGFGPRATHLLGAGTATLLLFAIGFRLMPRFLVAEPPTGLVWFVLPAGALGPPLIAAGFGRGVLFQVGAILEAGAIGGFALAYGIMFHRSDRKRVGFYGVLAGVVAGVVAAGLGLWFAIDGQTEALIVVHVRTMLLGFLGLSILGVTFQFYPPAVGTLPGTGDRLAGGSIACLFAGIGIEGAGLLIGNTALSSVGTFLTLGGAIGGALVVASVFRARSN